MTRMNRRGIRVVAATMGFALAGAFILLVTLEG